MDIVQKGPGRFNWTLHTALFLQVEEGANATVTDLVTSLLEEEELGLPRATAEVRKNSMFLVLLLLLLVLLVLLVIMLV